MKDMLGAIAVAVDHLSTNPDTDIFPSPVDAIRLFSDRDAAIKAVCKLHLDFHQLAANTPPTIIRSLVPARYNGLRLGSQIPPVWNAYYLSLTIACAPLIEKVRAPINEVFSYRFEQPTVPDRLFNPKIGWAAFTEVTRDHCHKYEHVLLSDIGDFYHRIRVEPIVAALRKVGVASLLVKRLAQILSLFEVDRFGLPVGGPASRLLAELALVRFDERLREAGICSLRFVDDLRVFAEDEVRANKRLMTVSTIAWDEGFPLNRSKTRMLRTRDMLEELELARSFAVLTGNMEAGTTALPFLLTQDPYAEMRAQVDQALEQFATEPNAASGVLREFSKARLNLSLARNLLASFRFIDANDLGPLLIELLGISERPAMIPIFARLVEAIEANLSRLDVYSVTCLRDWLESFFTGDSAVAEVELHRSIALRLLCRMPPVRQGSLSPTVLDRCRKETSPLIRREALALSLAWGDSQAFEDLCTLDDFGQWELSTAAMNTKEIRSAIQPYCAPLSSFAGSS